MKFLISRLGNGLSGSGACFACYQTDLRLHLHCPCLASLTSGQRAGDRPIPGASGQPSRRCLHLQCRTDRLKTKKVESKRRYLTDLLSTHMHGQGHTHTPHNLYSKNPLMYTINSQERDCITCLIQICKENIIIHYKF